MYREYRPTSVLSPYIETYWTFNSIVDGSESLRILPDGCVDILLNCSDVVTESGLTPFSPYVVGTMTGFSDVNFTYGMKMVGIRFRPGGITAFINAPIHEITNRQIELSLLETVFDKAMLTGNLPEKKDINEIVKYIDACLQEKLYRIYTPDKQVITAVKLIEENRGSLPVQEVLKSICLSQRQFERKFKSVIGLSPKTFSSVVRFQYAQELLEQQPGQSIFLTAIDCGYYDHAHFIRDFKRFTGTTPRQE